MSDFDQRTDEWHAVRAGKFTGSRFADVLAVSEKTGKPLKARTDLIWQLTAERMSGKPKDSVSSQAMVWGTEVEPFARAAYELETGETVVEEGFIPHPRYGAFCGVSPDGLVGKDGGIEIKCPKVPEIHLERFIDGVPSEYVPQIQGCMWVTGRKWWDFISYDPRFSGTPYEMLRIRVERDEAFIAKLEAAVLQAEVEVQALIKELRKRVA